MEDTMRRDPRRHVFGLLGIATVAGMMLVAGPSHAGDSSKSSLTNPILPAAGQVFTDCLSKGSESASGTKTQIKLSKVAPSAGDTDQTHCTSDDYICLTSTTENIGSARFCTSPSPPNVPCDDTDNPCALGTCPPPTPVTIDSVLVLHAEALLTTIQMKHDLCKDSTPTGGVSGSGPLCSGTAVPIAAYNTDMVCYKPDAAWTAAHPPTIKLRAPHQCEGVILGVRTTDSGGTLAVPANGIVAREGTSICK
jgi:hypothetical protein